MRFGALVPVALGFQAVPVIRGSLQQKHIHLGMGVGPHAPPRLFSESDGPSECGFLELASVQNASPTEITWKGPIYET